MVVESVGSLMFLLGTYYFLQGIGGNPGLHAQALKKFLKGGGFSPARASAFEAFINIPWKIKPLYGIVSDLFPIFGLRRKSYFILSGFSAAASYGLLYQFGITSIDGFARLLFVAGLAIAFSDVLCDAVMVEKGQPLGATDRLQAAQWFAIGLAGILVSFFKGHLAERFFLSQAVLFSMAAPLLQIFVTLFRLREERTFSSRDAARKALAGIFQAVRSKEIWAVSVFIFLYQFSPNLGSALYYYETDILGFSDVFIGYADTAGSVGQIAGVWLFGILVKRWSQETLLRMVIGSGVFSGLLYLFFKGETSALLVSLIAGFISVGAFLGILAIAARICPAHAEGTIFALLMSVYNTSTDLGGITGGFLYKRMGYSWLVIISAAFTAVMWFFLPLVREKTDKRGVA